MLISQSDSRKEELTEEVCECSLSCFVAFLPINLVSYFFALFSRMAKICVPHEQVCVSTHGVVQSRKSLWVLIQV